MLILAPSDLAEMVYAYIRLAVEDVPESTIVLAIWQAASIGRGHPKWRLSRIPLRSHASLAAQTIRVKDIDTTSLAKRRSGATDSSELPASFEKKRPSSKIRASQIPPAARLISIRP